MTKRTVISLVVVVIILTGGILTCALRWNAWFTMPPEPEWTGDTLSTRFISMRDRVAQRCLADDTLTMVILGDVHNTLEQDDYRHIARLHPDIDCYAQLGDFVEREQFYYKQLLQHQLDSTLFDSLPVIHCPGNHEYTKGLRRTLPDTWYASYDIPANGPEGNGGATHYVDFRYMRFIVIDTEAPHLLSDYTRLNAWTKKAISSACQPWVVVMMHRPVLASRKGRVNPMVWLTFSYALQRADIIFSGHDHTYARRGDVLQDEHETHTPVWIATSSTTHARKPKRHSVMDTIVAGGPFYEYMRVTEHELTVYSCEVDAARIDSIMLFKL